MLRYAVSAAAVVLACVVVYLSLLVRRARRTAHALLAHQRDLIELEPHAARKDHGDWRRLREVLPADGAAPRARPVTGNQQFHRALDAVRNRQVDGHLGNLQAGAARLFRAGGDDSVRGYGYRTLGPVVSDVVTSGRTLLTGSLEVARPISPKYPAFWWAAFIDAGNAADRWRDLHPVVGYGVGLRWRSPVGPLRVDLAYGQEVRQFRVHFSVGIAF